MITVGRRVYGLGAVVLGVPALAIGAHPVGSALYQQLRQVGQDVTGLDIAECGHIIPLDRPEALLAALSDFLP